MTPRQQDRICDGLDALDAGLPLEHVLTDTSPEDKALVSDYLTIAATLATVQPQPADGFRKQLGETLVGLALAGGQPPKSSLRSKAPPPTALAVGLLLLGTVTASSIASGSPASQRGGQQPASSAADVPGTKRQTASPVASTAIARAIGPAPRHVPMAGPTSPHVKATTISIATRSLPRTAPAPIGELVAAVEATTLVQPAAPPAPAEPALTQPATTLPAPTPTIAATDLPIGPCPAGRGRIDGWVTLPGDTFAPFADIVFRGTSATVLAQADDEGHYTSGCALPYQEYEVLATSVDDGVSYFGSHDANADGQFDSVNVDDDHPLIAGIDVRLLPRATSTPPAPLPASGR